MSSAGYGGLRSSSLAVLRVEDEVNSAEMQGIGSILCFSSEEKRNKRTESLRRTFSADMSSKGWVAPYGPRPIKKIASSEEFSIMSENKGSSSSSSSLSSLLSSSSEESEEKERPGQLDIWSSIQSQKANDLSKAELPSPYIHPLVKRLASSLSEKSLEICTESLGSETGSDGFSSGDCSYPPSEVSDEDDHQEEEEAAEVDKEVKVVNKELGVVNYHHSIGRKSPPRAFPPPLTSISRRDGPCLQVRPHRKDGRLVLEAIPVPSHNYLHAQRHGGRLLLSFVNATQVEDKEEQDEEEEEEEEEEKPVSEEVEEQFEEEIEEEIDEDIKEGDEEVKEIERKRIVLELEVIGDHPNGIMPLHRSAFIMNKFMSGTTLNNRNPWAEKLARMVNVQQPPLAPPHNSDRLVRSLPSAFNDYECCWKSGHKLISKKGEDDKLNRGNKGDKGLAMVPMHRCNEPHKPQWNWEPQCIATT
eukprot:TRINITY_DN265_c0_g3_i1.p1 TRINITY_DN265_c0_g3~~TRINITY_DN265_c0_g3_i1.p1  ORF type:complete len:473 (-),score=81.06 TRINITY_DN265_c0_g3_i1:178-1596(-)